MIWLKKSKEQFKKKRLTPSNRRQIKRGMIVGDSGKEYWLIPPEIYKELDKEFKFDFDPCPYPCPEGYDGTEVEWGKSTWCNPPFRKADGKFGKGPTAFIRKAIEESKKGKDVVVIINTNAFINMLVEAGAEMRSMGRVKWLDGRTKEPWKSPSCTTLFVLKGKK